jgi:TolB-like protein
VDALTDRKIWADVLDCNLRDVVAVNTNAAHRIAATIESKLRSGGAVLR